MASPQARNQASQARETAARSRDMAREQARETREQAQTLFQKLKQHSPGPLGWLGLLIGGGILATVTVITLIVLTPVFLLFSPILVPVGIFLFLCTAGLLTAIGAGIVTVSVISWLYRYFKEGHPPGAEQVEHAMQQVRHKARDIGEQLQTKVQEAAPGA